MGAVTNQIEKEHSKSPVINKLELPLDKFIDNKRLQNSLYDLGTGHIFSHILRCNKNSQVRELLMLGI